MATFTLFDEFIKYLGDGTIDLDTHTFKAILTNSAPVQGTNTIKSDITEITAANGYSSGGVTMSGVTWTETSSGSGVWRFTASSPAWTASGGSIATHQYLVVYDDTPTSPADPLVGYVDSGASSVIANGNTRTWTISAGLFDADATP